MYKISKIKSKRHYQYILNNVRNRSIFYIKPSHIYSDFHKGCLYKISCEGKIVAHFSLIYSKKHKMICLKRVSKIDENRTGIVKAIDAFLGMNIKSRVSVTPYIKNEKMNYILEKLGFKSIKQIDDLYNLRIKDYTG